LSRWHDRNGGQRLFGTKAKIALAKRAVDANPRAAMAHFALAGELFQIEDFVGGVDSFERGLAFMVPSPRLYPPYVAALTALGRADAALAVIDGLGDVPSENADILVERGCALSQLKRSSEACRDLRRALSMNPHSPKAALALTALLIEQKDWHGLIELAQDQLKEGSVSCPLVHGKIVGLIGLGRVEEAMRLTDFSTFVSVQIIEPPAEFSDLHAFNAALSADLTSASKIRLSDVPRLRLTGGVQVEDLEHDSSPAMFALMAILRREVDNYVGRSTGLRAEVLHGLLPAVTELRAWALLLGPDDTQDSHYHLNSSVAGVYYVDAPEAVLSDESDAGCLAIPSEIKAIAPSAVRFIKPVPGRLVLFPGYIPHRTVATRTKERRVSIAFDVLAAHPLQ
jgi:hypothetical protein